MDLNTDIKSKTQPSQHCSEFMHFLPKHGRNIFVSFYMPFLSFYERYLKKISQEKLYDIEITIDNFSLLHIGSKYKYETRGGILIYGSTEQGAFSLAE